MDLKLSEEQRMLVAAVRRFIREEIVPLEPDLDPDAYELPKADHDRLVAMVKDSSLVSVLGVADITQLGKVTAAGNFRYFETYNVVALIYLLLTVTLSLALRRLERRLRGEDRA